ncbi:MAG TPA: proline racemase family protein [Opitutaceae bacterium]|nr:proline racemase family protein [Opitutaceae bacterium]
MSGPAHRVRFVDSHTGGEPTRVVIEGGPDLGGGPLVERVARFRRDHDRWRRAIVCEPRGSDTVVGALLCAPHDPSCDSGVIFFNNVGYLGMCGHGTIGLVATLAHLDRVGAGTVRVDTPAGPVACELHRDGSVSVENVESYRERVGLVVEVPGFGGVRGDVAYGGNWFFITEVRGQDLGISRFAALTDCATRILAAVRAAGFPQVDHVELTGPPRAPGANARNFVLCPGLAYDRSPCGTGTSAKLACLAADGKLAEGASWVQESIIGSTFAARYAWSNRATGRIKPTITGTAHVTTEGVQIIDERDPFAWGI